MQYDAIIFDMDGTLWDSREGVVESWNEVFIREGDPARTSVEQMSRCMGLPMDALAEVVISDRPFSETRELFEKCFENENQYLAKHGGRLYPRLEETLKELKKKYRLFIVSNCQCGYIEAMFEAHGLGYLFEDIECFGNNNALKDANIRLIAERNRVKHALYVGDIQADADSAHQAGCDFCWARYGFGQVKDAEYEIDCFASLLDIL